MRKRLSYANVAATLALVIAVASGGGAAIAEPIADTAASTAASVKKALELGEQSDKRSKRAVELGKESNKRSKRALKLGRQSNKRPKRALRAARTARSTANRALAASTGSYSKSQSDERYMLKAGVPVRALSADSSLSADNALSADSAQDSDKLDGLDSTAFGRAAQTASPGDFRLVSNGNVDCDEVHSPSVTVDVGPSGLVAVYAEASMAAGSTDGGRMIRTQLHEPTAIPGCETILSATSASATTVRTLPGATTGTTSRGGWLIYRVPPGERTFSLRFGHTGNGFGIFPHVQDPVLTVVPL